MAVAITDEPTTVVPLLQPLWHEKAPPQFVNSTAPNDPIASWKVWQEHLRDRRKPATPSFDSANDQPLLWGWPAAWQRDTVQSSIETPSTLAEVAIGEDTSAAPDLPLALQLVALAYALPRLAQELPAETWWFLVERLHLIATQARSERVDWSTDPQGVVRNQLLAGELPLALGYLFPEVRALRALRDDARVALSEALVELTDGQGLPHGKLLPVLAPLFACWTRCRSLGDKLRRGSWSRAAELQYQWLVRHAIRLAKGNGEFHWSPSDANWCEGLFAAALKLAGDRGDHAAALDALPSGIVKRPKQIKRRDLPKPSLNSDWAGVTIMSNGWSQSATRLALNYASHPLTMELSVDGETLLAGGWTSSTLCNGEPVHATGEWEQLCWESGKRFDFLEVGLPLSSGLRLERQIVFGREDRVLYLADIILTSDDTPQHVRHSVELPLASGATWMPEADTRDGTLALGDVQAAIMPLGLREWRADPRGGLLEHKDGRLALTQEAKGRALCCPLFIDLKSKRSQTERTWRQLTIAEWMEIIPNDVAVGYRAQSGDDQWLFYRSLGAAGNRTLLGHNIAGEFCAGRFVDGKFKEWIEIEPV